MALAKFYSNDVLMPSVLNMLQVVCDFVFLGFFSFFSFFLERRFYIVYSFIYTKLTDIISQFRFLAMFIIHYLLTGLRISCISIPKYARTAALLP
jgi:hypothetical protein